VDLPHVWNTSDGCTARDLRKSIDIMFVFGEDILIETTATYAIKTTAKVAETGFKKIVHTGRGW